jgi:3-dehydroquinate dehydratase
LRWIGIASTDTDSFDFKMRKSERKIESVVSKLKKHGKGIVLMHDFRHATSLAVPELLVQLKTSGYKIVQVKAKEPVQTLAEYDQQLEKELGGGTVKSRPMLSVVRTISE